MSGTILVVAAYTATAEQVVTWQEERAQRQGFTVRSRWRDSRPDLELDVCFVDGDFGEVRGPTSRPDRATRMILIVGGGRPDLYSYGPMEQIPIEDPASITP